MLNWMVSGFGFQVSDEKLYLEAGQKDPRCKAREDRRRQHLSEMGWLEDELGSKHITPLIHHSSTPVDTYGSSPSTVPTPFKWLRSPQVCRNQFLSS